VQRNFPGKKFNSDPYYFSKNHIKHENKQRKTMRKTNAFALSLLLGAMTGHALTFDFEDPKGVNNARFNLDAPLEAISGTTNGISGTIEYDPKHPENTHGEIIISTGTLTVPNSTMQEHLHSEDWLHVENYPEIHFVSKSIDHIEKDGDQVKAHVTGDITIKGVTKEIIIPVTFTYLPNMLSDRTNGAMEGDLLVVRSNFSVHRDDFGIMAGKVEDKVANEIEIRLAIAGAAPKS
jgi:polyisoprenoid-binding protein YceI